MFGMLLVMRDGPMPRTAEMLAARPTLTRHIKRLSKLTRQGSRHLEEEASEPA